MSITEYMTNRRIAEKDSLYRIDDELNLHQACAREMVRIYKEHKSKLHRQTGGGWVIILTYDETLSIEFSSNDIFHDMFLDSQKYVVHWSHRMGRFSEIHSMQISNTSAKLFGNVVSEMNVLSLYRILRGVK